MVMPGRRIFDEAPRSWTELQNRVAQVFTEVGCEVAIEKRVELSRGCATLDVVVEDRRVAPPSLYICECKYWNKRVPKSVVHAFRAVVSDLGANRGLLISAKGFQAGANEAARFTNVDLLTWQQFEDLMFDRWYAAITFRLHRLFGQVFPLMDPSNENLWKLREFTGESYEEWDRICRRYPLITIWVLSHEMSGVGLAGIPRHGLRVRNGTAVTVLDSYRRIVDAAPIVCRRAHTELSRFWRGGRTTTGATAPIPAPRTAASSRLRGGAVNARRPRRARAEHRDER
jgi:Restriction endonuclease